MVQINKERCAGCGQCAENCAVQALAVGEDGKISRFRELFCYRCGQCVALCPTGALSMPELEPPVEYESAAFDLRPEALLNAMRFRRSIRRFTGEKLTRQELKTLLEAGRCAPTSCNSQTVRFVVLDREFEALRPRIWASFAEGAAEKGQRGLLRRYQRYLADPQAPDQLFYGSSQMIVVTAQYPIDGALALANMELMAHAMGLGALYCGFAAGAIRSDEGLRQYFGVSENHQLVSCLIVGKTDLRFHRTAPRNPAQAEWR